MDRCYVADETADEGDGWRDSQDVQIVFLNGIHKTPTRMNSVVGTHFNPQLPQGAAKRGCISQPH